MRLGDHKLCFCRGYADNDIIIIERKRLKRHGGKPRKPLVVVFRKRNVLHEGWFHCKYVRPPGPIRIIDGSKKRRLRPKFMKSQ